MRERALIEAISAALERREGSRVVRWIGDDCAVVRAGGYAAVSTDVMVDGTHFRLGQASPEDAGWRALAGAPSPPAGVGAPARGGYPPGVFSQGGGGGAGPPGAEEARPPSGG